MKTVHKYPVEITDEFWVEMPAGAEVLTVQVLTVQVQQGEPFLWAKVDTAAPYRPHGFRLIGTGLPAGDDPGRYVGSFQLEGGTLVFHLFTWD